MNFEQLLTEYSTGNYTFGFELECLFPKAIISVKKQMVEVEYEIVDKTSLLNVLKQLTNNNEPVITYFEALIDNEQSRYEQRAAFDANEKDPEFEIDTLDFQILCEYTSIKRMMSELKSYPNNFKLGEFDSSNNTYYLPSYIDRLVKQYEIDVGHETVEQELDSDEYLTNDELINKAQTDYFDIEYPKYFGDNCESSDDGSIKLIDEDENDYFPIEVKSTGGVSFGINKLSSLSKFLNQCAADKIVTNKSCGFHIHFKFKEMTATDAVWVGLNYLFNPDKKLNNALTKSNIPDVNFATPYSRTPDSNSLMKTYAFNLLEIIKYRIKKEAYESDYTFPQLLVKLFQDKNNNYPLLLIHPVYGTFEWRGLRGILDNGNKNITTAIKHIYAAAHAINVANETTSFEIEPGIVLTKNYIASLLKDVKNSKIKYPIELSKNKNPFEAKVLINANDRNLILKKMMPLYKNNPIGVLDGYKMEYITLTKDGYEATDESITQMDYGFMKILSSKNLTLPDSIGLKNILVDLRSLHNIQLSFDGQGGVEKCVFYNGEVDFKERAVRNNVFMNCNIKGNNISQLLKDNFIFPCGSMSYDYLDVPLDQPFNILLDQDQYFNTIEIERDKPLLKVSYNNNYLFINGVNTKSKDSSKFGKTVGSFINYVFANYMRDQESLKLNSIIMRMSGYIWRSLK